MFVKSSPTPPVDAESGAEDARLVAADRVPEVEQIHLELLARDDGAFRAGEPVRVPHRRLKNLLRAPDAARFLSNPLAARQLWCPHGKQKPA